MPRKTYSSVPPEHFDLIAGAQAPRATAWKHNVRSRTAGQGSDGINRQAPGTQQVVVGGRAGRPSDPYEALMQTKPHDSPVTDSESLDVSQGRVDALLGMLPPNQRAVLTMIVFEGLSVRDTAEHLTIKKSQVDRDYQAGLRALAALLGQPRVDLSGMTKFQEQTVPGLYGMAPDQPPELGEYLPLTFRKKTILLSQTRNGRSIRRL